MDQPGNVGYRLDHVRPISCTPCILKAYPQPTNTLAAVDPWAYKKGLFFDNSFLSVSYQSSSTIWAYADYNHPECGL
jgi:hypothetical protein